MKKRVTIGDVAEAAGVSKQTVSRAINDKGEINAETKRRVMEVVRELGYRPSRLARAMGSQQTRMVGLIVPDITNLFFPEVARGVQDAALEEDYTVLVVNTDESAEQETRMLELMSAQAVDGIISFTHHMDESRLLAFADGYRPMLLINREVEHPNIDLLLVDNGKGAELAVDHLIENGHRHIGMLTNVALDPTDIARVHGYLAALTRHALTDHLFGTQASSDGGYRGTLALLQNNPQISALFCYNDMMAIGAMRACHELDKHVPEDVAIVGYDDIQLMEAFNPPVSSVYIDKYRIGRLAFKRLLNRIEQPDDKLTPIRLDPELHIRASSHYQHQ